MYNHDYDVVRDFQFITLVGKCDVMDLYINIASLHHAVSANRILWVYVGFWWYHGILVVHLQDSVGAFGAKSWKWLTKWLHHAKAPPRRGVLRWEWSNKDVHLVTTFVFCHVLIFFSGSFIVKTCPQNAEVWYTPISRSVTKLWCHYGEKMKVIVQSWFLAYMLVI